MPARIGCFRIRTVNSLLNIDLQIVNLEFVIIAIIKIALFEKKLHIIAALT